MPRVLPVLLRVPLLSRRRGWLAGAALLGVAAMAPPATAVAASAARPPNVITILADDMGWFDWGHKGLAIDTPNLDRLAQEGVRLQQFYSSSPICSPARAGLLTGRYPHSVGVPELASPVARGAVPVLALQHAAVTIPEALRPLGYRSALVGKWHLGFHSDNWPRTHGFDYFWGSLLGTPGFWEPLETYENETPITVHGYFTDRITDQAVAFVRESAARPFFLFLSYNAPHYPLEAPAALVYKYRRRFSEQGLFAVYAAMIERMDAGIGRVLATLDELKLAGDTLVVFSSDNGPSPEANHYGLAGARLSAGPLREHKFSVHEGGIRVPFIARWPGRIPAQTQRGGPGILMDLLPTFLEAVGLPAASWPKVDGESLLPLLKGEAFERKAALHWETQNNAAVREGDWKLVHRFWEERPRLYQLANDMGEDNDLAAQYPDRVARMMTLHAEWKQRSYPNPIPRITQPTGRFPQR